MTRILVTIDAAPNSPRCPSKCRMRDPYMLTPPGCRAFREHGKSAQLPADSRGYLRCQQCLDSERVAAGPWDPCDGVSGLKDGW